MKLQNCESTRKKLFNFTQVALESTLNIKNMKMTRVVSENW